MSGNSNLPVAEVSSSFGVLILGMHRSGTSGMAAAFAASGFDPGARVVGSSAGNEAGHWEDQFAVDLHDSLLHRFGTRWDLPFGLPGDWRESAAADEAVARIRAYLREDRARHPLWVMKDPRACLFASLWNEALSAEAMPWKVVLAIRHPFAVAQSLHRRDGLSEIRSLGLWLDHTLAALGEAGGDAIVVDYDALLQDAEAASFRISEGLAGPAAAAVRSLLFAAALDPSRRHHVSKRERSPLPPIVQAVWDSLSSGASNGVVGAALGERLLADARWLDWLRREARDREQFERLLWQRVGRAEATLAAWSASPGALPEGLGRIEAAVADMRAEVAESRTSVDEGRKAVDECRRAVDESKKALVDVFSGDIRRMQDLLRERDEAWARLEGERTLAASLAPRIEALQGSYTSLQASLLAQGEVTRDLTRGLEEARRENATLAFHNERLAETARQFELVLASRSWRWTRPLRALARLLRGHWTRRDSRRLREQFAGPLAERVEGAVAPNVASGLPALSLPRADLPDVFVWGVIDWHFRFQRPQHLATALARKGHRVFYVSNNTIDAPGGGFDFEALDDCGRLYQVRLQLAGAPPIYFGMPNDAEAHQLRASLAALLAWTTSSSCIALVQHPFWTHTARALPNHRLVYDCMDHHAGFDNTGDAVLRAEAELVGSADLTIVSSAWLESELAVSARATALIRNAGDYEFFSSPPAMVERDRRGRRIIGYYGAIAEWFDHELVRRVAVAYPDVLVRLVGADTAGVAASLSDLPNVEFTGEVPYADLPRWLHGFDVCLLPFKVLPLTLATNPVKVYEYLAAGKPVVAVDLPEMGQFEGVVHAADSGDAFVRAVGHVLSTPADVGAIAERQSFAASQTWAHRADALDAAIEGVAEPRVSVIVLAYNNLEFTKACLESVELYSDYPRLEVVVVDNASTDGSSEWLKAWEAASCKAGHTRRLLLNARNLGFAAGNNVGMVAATGEVLILLNNDTYVTPGWVRSLCAHLRRDPGLGLIGPVTNNIGNEAKIPIAYEDMTGMIAAAGVYTRAHCGQRLPIRTAAFFCVAMRREVFAAVGGLDEAFGLGFFEDDDYCRRVERAGWSIACAEDVFVHHHLSASFDALKAETKHALFQSNKAIYEAKWGPWVPHRYRDGHEG